MTFKDSSTLISAIAHGESQSDVEYMLRTRMVRVLVPGDATAADASQFPLMIAEADLTLVSAKLLPGGTLTADDTDYATLAIGSGDTEGGALSPIETVTTKATGGTGSWAKGKAIDLVPDRTPLAKGKRLALDVTKEGSGVALPDTLVEITYELK